ncbi:Pbi1p NDAI_0G00860 [Naumovozyma dairenensis CBS 421]|uniref:Alcohol acetyltransferase n=1 Tax=Naumovozyma dairenensis (strain ATCC 10597 / BCRC 20456 / CBS 421 / NBRC 0211 / NRRL Y-12639) TaxID=1071378 RepID=G0WDK1_NAUDC|nr:hypothetical protein NDAI_0G00860 [Naumovozyma dairenensis CBS 421]CCD25862.2 hypothetical protein NDAI_0G00860 [Naumovozyma dairenensis CBS 421]
MSIRALSSFEKKVLSQTLDSKRNGISYTARYVSKVGSSSDSTLSDAATLLATKDIRLNIGIVTRVLERLIKKHIELYSTINENYEFQILTKIKPEDVISVITFDTYKDEQINCHSGAPPYLLRHIFNKEKFELNKPLWKLYIIDETMIIFHGFDMLFDIFSAANFHKLFFDELNDYFLTNTFSKSNSKPLDVVFKINVSDKNFVPNFEEFPRSIFDNPKLHLPAMTPDLFNLQTKSFFKTIYSNTIKKPIDLFNGSNSHTKNDITSQLKEYQTHNYLDMLGITSSLCGTTVFGTVSPTRYNYLKGMMKQDEICLRSFICGIVMICLKPSIKNYSGNIIFSIPINLRNYIDGAKNFGLFYKDVKIDCPLSLIDDRNFKYNGYKDSSIPDENDLEFNEKLLEYQFKQVTEFIENVILERLKIWEKFNFNDDDIKRMKFDHDEVLGQNSKIIQINDTTEIMLGENDNNNKAFTLTNPNFTRTLSGNEFMSVSFAICEETGLNVCIHYPDGYSMETFVECFQTFIEE